MFDDANWELIPPDAAVIAVYIDGTYKNIDQLKAKFPHARFITIAVRASDDADALDDEPGDATNDELKGWVARQHARGVVKPIIYTSVSNIDSAFAATGVTRDKIELWSAHYGQGDHICGIATCGLCRNTVDWTQFTDKARGISLDMTDMGAAAPAKPVVTIPESALQHVQHDIAELAADMAKVQAVEADLKDAEKMEAEISAYVKQHG
ncbi:hypothetical protein EAS64_33935 [Trebonia kvetii]|uniref:Uncharacterized protein n=1 Tax=Trebonia kvetii TaxID=2480626 RepID=A0A6P2BQH2_9ACTN|nr:hypothetical protein [Trebonia kvetii]TVZ01282.1 hypothetical protein EAS64_33935 [Trebonia kvetii]